jgi:glutathione S-transferase
LDSYSPFSLKVPLLTDGDFVLAQSNAIARYLANKHHLYGTPQQGAVADMILDGYADFLNKVFIVLVSALFSYFFLVSSVGFRPIR